MSNCHFSQIRHIRVDVTDGARVLAASSNFAIFNMKVLKVSLVLITIACQSVGDPQSQEEKELQKKYAKNAFSKQNTMSDRGYIARFNLWEKDIRLMDLKTVQQYASSLVIELECSFVFSVLVHINLFDMYFSDPKKGYNLLTEYDKPSMKFMDETLYIISYAFEKKIFSLFNIMWIYYFLDRRTYDYIVEYKFKNGSEINKKFQVDRAIVKQMLEQFTQSYGCQVYDQRTGFPQEEVYVNKIPEVIANIKKENHYLMRYNKDRFTKQRRTNVAYNTNSFYFDRWLSKDLELYNLITDRKSMENLLNNFGVHVDSNGIVEHFEKLYQGTIYVDASLQEYIQIFIRIQNDYMTTLKAMALRLVVVVLNRLKYLAKDIDDLDQEQTQVSHPLAVVRYNYYKVINIFLTKFAKCIGQPDDLDLDGLKTMENSYLWWFKINSRIENWINKVYGTIEGVISGNPILLPLSARFDYRDFGDTSKMSSIKELYRIVIEKPNTWSGDDWEARVLEVADIFVEYIKQNTYDIKIMNSLSHLQASDAYLKLAE